MTSKKAVLDTLSTLTDLVRQIRHGDAEAQEAMDTVRVITLSQLGWIEQHTPDWEQAPTWANWWAIDQNGEANWYREQPRVTIRKWIGAKRKDQDAQTLYHKQYGIIVWDWKDTIKQRP